MSLTTRLIVEDLKQATKAKLEKLREQSGLENPTWADYFDWFTRDIRLGDTFEEVIAKNAREHMLPLWCRNFADNLPAIRSGKSITDLVPEEAKENPYCITGPGIVIGNGPSLYEHKHLDVLAKSNFKGTVIATDSTLLSCLRAGKVPDYVLSVDGNREKILPFYDDPIVDEYGSRMKVILCSTVAQNVWERCKKAGMEVYWLVPWYDDHRRFDSWTTMQMRLTATDERLRGIPATTSGGNAGSTAFVIAYELLRLSPIALIGLDMGYPDGYPLEKTAYWQQFMEGTSGNIPLIVHQYDREFNPKIEKFAMMDRVFRQYRDTLLALLKMVRPTVRVINCTEGGNLWSDDPLVRLEYMKFEGFLKETEES